MGTITFFFFFVADSEVVSAGIRMVEKPVGMLMLVMGTTGTADSVLDSSCDSSDSELGLGSDGGGNIKLLFELLEGLTGTVAKPVEV
jgi:hypothetical protein